MKDKMSILALFCVFGLPFIVVVEGYPLLNKVAALSSGIHAEHGMLGRQVRT